MDGQGNLTVGMRISEAAQELGVSAATLRLWEHQGLIQPARTPGGQRLFRSEDLVQLRRIQYLRRAERLNPPAIARILADEGGNPATNSVSSRDDARRLGERLRAWRRRTGLTLKQVAERTSLSVPFLSSVERGVTGLSITNLYKLASLYGITVSDLMGYSHQAKRLVKGKKRPKLVGSGGGVLIEQLALGTRKMEVQLFTIKPGSGSEGVYAHEGEEFVFVLRGSFEIWLDQREHYVLEPGDCLYFPCTLPHWWRNPGSEETELLWVNTPPTI